MANGKVVWFGWITFAAVMLTMLGLFNVFEGLVALLENNVTYVNGDNLVVVNLTGWGILLLVFGALLIVVGIGLLARSKAARIAAIVVVGLHALAQIAALSAYPVWSLLMIALDVVILFALTAHWADSTLEDEHTAPAAVGAHSADSPARRPEPRTGSDAHPAPST